MIFTEEQWLGFQRFVTDNPDLDLTIPQARYLVAFLKTSARDLARNAGAVRKAVAIVGRVAVPLVINDGSANDCYLISPYAHYISYMKHEVRKMRPRWVSLAIRSCLTVLGWIARPLGFSRAVSINNWFFTTPMSNSLGNAEVSSLRVMLRRNYVDHAFVYREFKSSATELATALACNGFRRLIHRPVFEWQPQSCRPNGFRRSIRRRIRQDLALTETGPYTVRRAEPGAPTDLAARYYEALYIHKHSPLNAQYTSTYFDIVLATGVNQVSFLELGGRTVGFLTTCSDRERVIASLVGYDQALAAEHPSPYRAAVGEAFRQSLDAGCTLFLSTGVATFKKRRGATESMEYEAFDVAHLKWPRRLPWYAIAHFLDALIGQMDTGAI